MQKDLKKVMAGEMEVVVNEEKSVLVLPVFLCSQVTRHLLDYLFLCSTILEYFASFLFCLHPFAFGKIKPTIRILPHNEFPNWKLG